MYKPIVLLFTILFCLCATAQDMTPLVMKIKEKLDQVMDYEAEGRMKTDVAFIKAPVGRVRIFFKKPDKFRVKREGGISVLPKGGVSVNINSLITTTGFVALAAGEAMVSGVPTKVVKLLPTDENSEVVLTTLYIDDANLLVKKAITTTKENGTYEIELSYGRFAQYGLPDKMIFSFNTKNYNLPKGIALEFEDSEQPLSKKEKLKNKKGRVEISYSNYSINKGIPDTVFK